MKALTDNVLISSLVLCLALLNGCSSNPPSDREDGSDSRKAAESNTALGLEYMNRGQYEVALGKLKKAVAEDSDYAPAHTVLAALYEQIGELELAGTHYQKAVKSAPDNGDVNNNYGVYLCKTGEPDKAQGFFRKALDDPFYGSPAVALTNAGSCALGADELTDADDYLRRALRDDPEFPDALYSMARLGYLEEDYMKSRAFIQRYEVVGRQTAESLFLGFQIETSLGNDQAAKKYATILNSEFPESLETKKALGSADR